MTHRETNLGLKLFLLGIFSAIIGLCFLAFSFIVSMVFFAIAALLLLAALSWAVNDVRKEQKRIDAMFEEVLK